MTVGVDRSPLAGRREAALLELPSVRRMAEVLTERCRGSSWVRTLVPALDRFATLTSTPDLEALLAAARADATVAARSLDRLVYALAGHPPAAVAGLATAPKVWFRLGGVPVAWRPLTPAASRGVLTAGADLTERLVHLVLIGSGLRLAELLRLRLGDLGSLDEDGAVVHDLDAEPLAVRYEQRQGRTAERLTFLSFEAGRAVRDEVARRRAHGFTVAAAAPLVARSDGRPATRATVERARRRSNGLIRAGNRINVELCRTTGDFFRAWGLPGSRFKPTTSAEEHER